MKHLQTLFAVVKPVAASVVLLLCLPQWLYATSVLQVDMEQLLNDAAVIFEGEVIASEARWNDDNTYISTWVTFAVDDVIKGELPTDTIIQSFAGGTVGDTSLNVSGMVYPELGEKGIYFIEDPQRPQVNPIVGWSQGHFKVETDEYGTERMLTENNDPIQGLEDTSPDNTPQQRAAQQSALPLSEGAAQGLRVGSSTDALNTAIDKNDFKKALKVRLSQVNATDAASDEAKAQK
ncbi:Uncharacterised protein [Halioglobus japonicus]|nr:Uncharacterised protein [Halioglobus japonicus]